MKKRRKPFNILNMSPQLRENLKGVLFFGLLIDLLFVMGYLKYMRIGLFFFILILIFFSFILITERRNQSKMEEKTNQEENEEQPQKDVRDDIASEMEDAVSNMKKEMRDALSGDTYV